jgi:hypothetical protein
MKRRTLYILGLGLPATLAVSAVVVAGSDPSSTATHSSQLSASVTKLTKAQTPSVTINGQAVPVQPNATTHFSDGSTQAAIQSSGSTTSTQGQNSSTSVNVTQSSNGNGTSTSDVTTSGDNSVTITSNSSVEASGGGVHITPPASN